jgi:uncharacterized protein (TIGR03083 family)
MQPFGRDGRADLRWLMAQDRAALLGLLGSLTPEEWAQTTAAAPWSVREVVAHILGDDVSRLARGRDGYQADRPSLGEPLAVFIHRFNQQWVDAMRRASPPVLVDLLTVTTEQVVKYWESRDLDALGEPVSWVGPDPAPVWLDCARDATEYWVHQQQIREATGRPGGTEPATLRAILDTFLYAVPLTLADRDGSALTIATDVGRWSWVRGEAGWRRAPAVAGGAVLTIDADVLWRVCVRMVEPDQARARAHIDGAAASAVLDMVSIIR